MKLTNIAIKNAEIKDKTYKLFDGEGLFLQVNKSGSKLWRMKYRFHNKEKLLSLGKYPEVTLQEARDKKYQARRLLSKGVDPSADKRAKKADAIRSIGNSFEAVAKEWHTTNLNKWSKAHGDKIWRRVELHLLPKLGQMPISEIKPMDILSVLRKIEERGTTEITHRILQTCTVIFRYAIVTERVSYNPASDLKGALVPHKTEHYPSIPISELKSFLEALEEVKSSLQNKLAMKLLMLTFVRTGEMRFSKWKDFDFENKRWVIPAELTKMKRSEHIVPLSNQAVAVLQELKEITKHCPFGYILPSQNRQKNPMMSENTINNLIKKMGYGGEMVGHGFRSLASTALNEQGYRPDVIERQLSHKEPNAIRAAYNRAEYLQERAKMMQDWADCIDVCAKGNVIKARFGGLE